MQDIVDGEHTMYELRHKVILTDVTVREYLRNMESAPPLEARGVPEGYRKLSEFNGAILAGKYSERYGCEFVTSEWVDGITKELSEAGILKEGSSFANVESFRCDGETCLLFPLEGADIDIGSSTSNLYRVK